MTRPDFKLHQSEALGKSIERIGKYIRNNCKVVTLTVKLISKSQSRIKISRKEDSDRLLNNIEAISGTT